MLTVLLCVLAFLSAVALDYIEATYVKAVACGRANMAGVCSISMWAIGSLGFVALFEFSFWLMIPEGLGFWVGTHLAMRGACKKPV